MPPQQQQQPQLQLQSPLEDTGGMAPSSIRAAEAAQVGLGGDKERACVAACLCGCGFVHAGSTCR